MSILRIGLRVGLRVGFFCGLAASLVGQDPFARVRLGDDERARVVAVLGSEPEAVFAAIGGGDGTVRRQAGFAFRSLPEAEQVRVARALLWSDDNTVALGASQAMSAWWFDVDEATRAAELQTAPFFAVDSTVDPVDFEGLLGAVDFTRIVGQAAPLPRGVADYVGALHRVATAGHLALLARLTVGDDALARQGAMELIRLIAERTERNRDVVATAVLGWPGGVPFGRFRFDAKKDRDPVTPRAFELPPDDGGFPPLLELTLRRVLVASADEFVAPFGPWVARWAVQERADVTDLPLVEALAKRTSREAHVVAARAAVDLAARGVLAQLADDADPTVAALAALGLARAGDATARARLESDPRPAFRAAWLEFDPDGARQAWTTRLIGDVVAVHEFATVLACAAAEPFRIAPDWLDTSVATIAAANPSPAVLAALVERLPAAHTRAIAERWFAALESADDDGRSLEGPAVTLLEVTDRPRLQAILRRFVDGDAGLARDRALRIALQLGDVERAAELVDFVGRVDREDADADSLDASPWLLLGRTPHPVVIAALLDRIREQPGGFESLQALAALELARGVDERLAVGFAADLVAADEAVVAARWPRLVADLDTRQRGDVVCAWLADRSLAEGGIVGLGTLDRPEVTEYLRRAAIAREHGLLRWATGELAVGGDPQARAQLERVFARGWQGWFDSVDPLVLTRGGDRATLDAWIDRLATNCCAEVTAARVLQSLLGERPELFSDATARTAMAAAREFVTRFGDRLVPSRIAGHLVVGPSH